MDILFIHGNYPGQFVHLAKGLASQPQHRVVFLTNRKDPEVWQLAGVEVRRFEPHRQPAVETHSYLQSSEQAVLNGQAVLRQLLVLLKEGFRPRLVIAHGGSGLQLFVKQVWPQTRLINYIEWFFTDATNGYLLQPYELNQRCRVSVRNWVILQELEACDVAVTPTAWQHQQFPETYLPKIEVIFDGVDLQMFQPRQVAGALQLEGDELASALVLEDSHLVLSYATRGMEPLRGFPEFMRMLPPLLKQFPQLQVVIAGQDRVAYSYPPSVEERSWKRQMLAELGVIEGLERIHFTGSLNYRDYCLLLCRSDLHVYFTRPYVTSWGLFQAAACGAHLMVNRSPATDYVLPQGGSLRVDLDDQTALAAIAGRWLEGAMARRDEKRQSMLQPEWALPACLHHWEKLLKLQFRQSAQ